MAMPQPPEDRQATRAAAEVVAAELRAAWRVAPAPDLHQFIREAAPDLSDALRALVLTDADEHQRHGLPVRAERYFQHYQQLPQFDWAWEVLAAELRSRQPCDEQSSWETYDEKYPELCRRAREELSRDRGAECRQPIDIHLDPGQVIDDFEVLSLLGQGAHARVYLARQRSLDRLLALKVSPDEGDEGRALARLSHPNIVAVFSESSHQNRRLLAMQYVPGRTLAAWIQQRQQLQIRGWRSEQLLRWLGSDLTAAERSLAAFHPESEAGSSSHGPPQGVVLPSFPPGQQDAGELAPDLPFVVAMCEIMTGLARALDHAHRHGVLHRDVKPANVLLDISGRALLTDFSVATRQDLHDSGQGRLGGTTAYMAPEHLQAMECWLPGAVEDVDTRSDMYSLGIVFYELLTGRRPFPSVEHQENGARQALAHRLQGPPPLAPLFGVTPALSAIVSRLLAPRREDRYQSASELLEDLQRWRRDLPPRFAQDPSLWERASRWTRRHRLGVAVGAAALLLSSSLLVGGVVSDVARLRRADQLIAAADHGLKKKQFATAARRLGEAEGVLSSPSTLFPDLLTNDRRRQTEGRLVATREQVAAHEFRQFDRELAAARGASFAGLLAAHVDSDEVERRAARWLQRVQSAPWAESLDEPGRRKLQEAVTELIVLRILAAGRCDDAASQRAARAMLTRVPPMHSELPLVELLREQEPSQLQLPLQGGEFELYLCGIVAASRGEYEPAMSCFHRSMELRSNGQPPRFWAAFSLAYCLQQMGRNAEAIASYGLCTGLRPDFAWPRYNLALAFIADRQWEAAERELLEAVRLDPELAQAHADLGAVQFQLQKYRDALACCDQAIELGLATSQVYANRAASRAATSDLEGARQDLRTALRIDPHNEVARDSLRRINQHLD